MDYFFLDFLDFFNFLDSNKKNGKI
jgi:hypothetical protein